MSQKHRDDPGQPRSSRHKESSPELEAMDMFLAFPRRSRKGWTADFARYVLECGHTVPADLPLDDDSKVRCRACYREQMAKAGEMLK